MLLLVWCVSGGGGFSKCKVLVSSLYVAALFFQYSSFPFSFAIFSRLGSLWRFWTAFPGRFSNYILTDTPKTHQIAHINYASARIMDWRLVFFMISGPPHPPPIFFRGALDVVFPVSPLSSLSDFALPRLTSSSPCYSFCFSLGKFTAEIYPRASCSSCSFSLSFVLAPAPSSRCIYRNGWFLISPFMASSFSAHSWRCLLVAFSAVRARSLACRSAILQAISG